MTEVGDDEAFIVRPGTDEYRVLSFLTKHHSQKFRYSKIAAQMDLDSSAIADALTQLHEDELIKQDSGRYYVEASHADTLKQRLKSVDAAEKLHELAPEDDVYTEESWTDNLGSISNPSSDS